MAAMVTRPRAIVSWSTGKDCAYALQIERERGELDVVGLFTTVTAPAGRVSPQGVREALLDRQAAALGLPCRKVRTSLFHTIDAYERELGEALLAAARDDGVTHVVFGDVDLPEARISRERHITALGLTPVFPLWARSTHTLARDILAAGIEATITRVDLGRLDRSFAGRAFDAALLAALPPEVDPCGEGGEFDTFATAGPMFAERIPAHPGDVVVRDGFAVADLVV